MPLYLIETSYHLPIYRHAAFEAASPKEACHRALEDDDWSNQRADFDCAGETYVSGIWLGAKAYEAESLPVPTQFDENVLRRASHFNEMLALLKEAAAHLQPDANWISRTEAAIRKATAILGDAPDPEDATPPSADITSP